MDKPIPVFAVPEGLGWDGWYFEDGYLCSKNHDRLTPLAVMATVLLRQTEAVRDLMYWRPSERSTDVVMHSFLHTPKPRQQRKQDLAFEVAGLQSSDQDPPRPGCTV